MKQPVTNVDLLGNYGAYIIRLDKKEKKCSYVDGALKYIFTSSSLPSQPTFRYKRKEKERKRKRG